MEDCLPVSLRNLTVMKTQRVMVPFLVALWLVQEIEAGVVLSWVIKKDPKAVTTKWIYKIKYNTDGIVDCYKAHWVARGFTT